MGRGDRGDLPQRAIEGEAREGAQGCGGEKGGSHEHGVRHWVQLLPILMLTPGELPTSPERVKSARI